MKGLSVGKNRIIEKPVSEWANFARNLNIRLLAIDRSEFAINEGTLPKSVSRFWSVYVPDNDGLILGQNKSAVSIPAGSIGLVPPGVNTVRDITQSFNCLCIHFDVGGYIGEQLLNSINKINAVSTGDYSAQLATIEKAIESDDPLRSQIAAQALVAALLADILINSKASHKMLPASHRSVLQIDPALQAIESRLYSEVYEPLKVQEMSNLCGIRNSAFPRFFHDVLGKNPTQYAQDRRIDVAVQQLLFTQKSIDQISSDLSFANRFYFSRVFKEEVGQSPAAYRDAFCAGTKSE